MKTPRLFLLAALGLAGCTTGGNYHSGNVDGELPSPSGAVVNSPTPGASMPGSSPAIVTAPYPAPLTAPPGPAAGSPDALAPAKNFNNVEIVDVSLKSKLTITRNGSSRTPNDLLSVYAGLKNRTSHTLKIEAQTIYQDASDNPLPGGASSWVPITLKAHDRTTYRSASLSADAQDYLIRIRPAAAATPATQ